MRVWSIRTAPVCLGVLTLLLACSPPPPVKRGNAVTGLGGTSGLGGSLNLDPDAMPEAKIATTAIGSTAMAAARPAGTWS